MATRGRVEMKMLVKGYHIGVYVRDDVDTRVLLREVEPALDTKQPSEIVCKILRAVLENQ